MKMEILQFKIFGRQQKTFLPSRKEVNSNTGLHQETKNYETNNLTLHLKELEKERQSPKLKERK